MLLAIALGDMVASTALFESIHSLKELKWNWPNKGDKRGYKGDSRSLVPVIYGLTGKKIEMTIKP